VSEQYCIFVSVCIAYSSIGVFRCDFLSFEFFSVKSFRNHTVIESLRKFVLLPY